MSIAADYDEFLRTHRWALVTTVDGSGAPQVTMVAYHWDGRDAVVSIRNTAVKWRNLKRDPRTVFTVTDDLRFLSLHGTAELIDGGPERDALTRRVCDSLLPQHSKLLQADIDKGLDASGRVIVRLVPEHAVGRV